MNKVPTVKSNIPLSPVQKLNDTTVGSLPPVDVDSLKKLDSVEVLQKTEPTTVLSSVGVIVKPSEKYLLENEEEMQNEIREPTLEYYEIEHNSESKTIDGYDSIPLYKTLIEDENKSVSKHLENNSYDDDDYDNDDDIILPPPPSYYSDSDSEEDESQPIETISTGNESYKTSRGEIFTVSTEECLQKDFQVLNSQKEYTVHLCLYKVVLDSFQPYLTYYLNKKENLKYNINAIYEFPTYKFQLSAIHNPLSPRTVKQMTGGAQDSDKFEAEFMEEIYQTVYSYCEDPQQLTSLDPYYRGFYIDDNSENGENDDDIYVVIDVTRLSMVSHDIVKATPYEILITRKLFETPIHRNVTDFFKKIKDESADMDFYHVKREDSTYVESPYSLYMCMNGIAVYENVSIASHDANKSNNVQYSQIIYPRIYHDKLGSTILLTTHAIDPKQATNLQRYVVFAEKQNTLYIEPDSDTTLDDIYLDNTPEYSVITYFDKSANRQYWSVSTALIVDEL
jgi:hypothetical protein